ncbi:putative quinol monooxygenase [Rothia sp. LK2588]|uniref:putative quinol monooxygenase n=1 Tax=Rothia sp. LK2588 TaxID=3114369 RepID=UPI0034CF8C81
MIFIVVKFPVTPGRVGEFLKATQEFTEHTRAEPGNLWFEWSRSESNLNEVVLVEAFKDDAAEAHVNSDHFKKGLETMRPFLTATPKILSRQIEGEGWDEMGELQID